MLEILSRLLTTITITNSHNSAEVTGSGQYAVGLAGLIYAGATIDNCYNEGKVSGGSIGNGGIVGSVGSVGSTTATITNSYNKADVSGGFAGGIVGQMNGTIDGCYNVGTISGDSHVGGISGQGGNVYNSFNRGNISAKIDVSDGCGGIVGYGYGGTVKNCYNEGNVKTNDGHIGGIAGFASSVSNAFNKGNIENDASFVGGIAGSVGDGDVDNCYNAGNVSGKGRLIGGIVATGKAISNSFNHGNIKVGANSDSSTGPCGGIAGSAGPISNCYNTGDIDPKGSLIYEIAYGTSTNSFYQKKDSNAITTGGTELSKEDMDKKMDLSYFLSLLNTKVEENNKDTSKTKLKKWKLENGNLSFAE